MAGLAELSLPGSDQNTGCQQANTAMAQFMSAPSPPPVMPPPPPWLPPGYAAFRIEMTPSALVATIAASFLGFCFCCAFCYLVVFRLIDNRVRRHQANSFNYSTRKV